MGQATRQLELVTSWFDRTLSQSQSQRCKRTPVTLSSSLRIWLPMILAVSSTVFSSIKFLHLISLCLINLFLELFPLFDHALKWEHLIQYLDCGFLELFLGCDPENSAPHWKSQSNLDPLHHHSRYSDLGKCRPRMRASLKKIFDQLINGTARSQILTKNEYTNSNPVVMAYWTSCLDPHTQETLDVPLSDIWSCFVILHLKSHWR